MENLLFISLFLDGEFFSMLNFKDMFVNFIVGHINVM